MNVAQAIVKTLADRGVDQCFLVPGGYSMHLTDAIAGEPRIKLTPVHHECAAAMAADGYARIAGKPALVCVSSGPAALNALNGVWGAYVDSVPMVVLSGCPRTETLPYLKMWDGRQLGDQQAGITGGVLDRMTKHRQTVLHADDWKSAIREALRLCTDGRPGPSWVEVPLDIQGTEAAENVFYQECSPRYYGGNYAKDKAKQVLDRLLQSQRPVILVGSGVRIANALPQLRELVRRLGVPVVTAWAVDAFPTDDPHFCGRQGTLGDMGGNRAVQESDFLLVLGSRLSIRQVGYNWADFAPKAFKAWVDVDPAELSKPTVKPDLPVCCDVREFLDEALSQTQSEKVTRYLFHRFEGHAHLCRQQWIDNPVVKPAQREWRGKINPYHFCEVLWSKLADDDVVVCGDASATIMMMQTAVIRGERRLLSNSGAASMGWCLPAVIGAAMARKREYAGLERVICVTGDGGIMQNVQELATIAHNRLPIKIFVLSNGGYASIRWSQMAHFGREVAAGPESGLGLPDICKVARAFGIGAMTIRDEHLFENGISVLLNDDGPQLAKVIVDPDQQFEPRLRSKRMPDGSMVTAGWEEFS
jgi:acetolactate synthase-1/2/3 large subunit